MTQNQLKKLKEFHNLIVDKKLNRKLIPIKQYKVYKKNSQIRILIKYRNIYSEVTSFAIVIKANRGITVFLKGRKLYYNEDEEASLVFKEAERLIISDIKIPLSKLNTYKKYNKGAYKSIFKAFLKEFNRTDVKSFNFVRNSAYRDSCFYGGTKDMNYELIQVKKTLTLKKIKNGEVLFKQENATIKDITKEVVI